VVVGVVLLAKVETARGRHEPTNEGGQDCNDPHCECEVASEAVNSLFVERFILCGRAFHYEAECTPQRLHGVACGRRRRKGQIHGTLELMSYDPVLAHSHLVADGHLNRLATRFGPLPLQPVSDRFSALVEAIVSQQLSGKAAATIWARVRALVGEAAGPAPYLEVSPEDLRTAGLSRQKVSYVVDLATRAQDGSLGLDDFDHMDDAEVSAHLTQVKGIGQWTADMFMMFVLHRPDILPVGDLEIRKSFARLFKLDVLPKPEHMQALAEPWRPYRTTACYYLWKWRDEPE